MILTHAELASASLGMAPAFMSTYQTLKTHANSHNAAKGENERR